MLVSPLKSFEDDTFGKVDEYSYIDNVFLRRYVEFLCSTIPLKYINNYCVIPCAGAGDGTLLTVEQWYLVFDSYRKVFGERGIAIAPAILYDDIYKVRECLRMALPFEGIIFLSIELFSNVNRETIRDMLETSGCSFGVHCKGNYTNEQILRVVRQYDIKAIKDSRKYDSFEDSLKLRDLYKGEVIWCADTHYDEHPLSIASLLFNNYPHRVHQAFFESGKLSLPYKSAYKALVNEYARWYNSPSWKEELKSNIYPIPYNYSFDTNDFRRALNYSYKVYSEEDVSNIHVRNFNSIKPVSSLFRCFMSDIFSFQRMYFRNLILNNVPFLFFFVEQLEILRVDSENSVLSAQCWKIESAIDKTAFQEYALSNYEIEYLIYEENLLDKIYVKCDGFHETSDTIVYKFGYTSQNKEDVYVVTLRIRLHPEYFSGPNRSIDIPQSVFEFLFRIAIFTKRNKLADDLKSRQSNLNAIAVVMARNMSHNVGSHVLSRMVKGESAGFFINLNKKNWQYKSFIKQIERKLSDKNWSQKLNKNHPIQKLWSKIPALMGRFDSLFEATNLTKESFEAKNKFSEDLRALLVILGELHIDYGYWNEELAYFFSYLKTRQDFLADIVTGLPQVQNSKQFKKELMEGIDNNRILLNRISGVDNFSYTFRFEGMIAVDEDIPVAISNDVIGQHAFYIILENIIRNTAKHGYGTLQEEKLHTFTIRVEESKLDSAYYQVTVFDNHDSGMADYVTVKFKRDDENYLRAQKEVFGDNYTLSEVNSDSVDSVQGEEISKREWVRAFVERLRGNFEYKNGSGHRPELKYKYSDKEYDYFTIKKIDQLVINQNIWINRAIIDEEFKLRQGAFGLIEMEACAAYLRRLPVENITSGEFKLSFDPKKIEESKEEVRRNKSELRILRAVNPRKNHESEERHNTLGYQFYIPKPKELLIIDETGNLFSAMEAKVRQDGISTEAIQYKVTEKLRELERDGILLLSNHKKTKERYSRKDEWRKWLYDKNTIYTHEMLLLESKVSSDDTAEEYLSGKLNSEINTYLEEGNEVKRKALFQAIEYKSAYLPNRILHHSELSLYFNAFYNDKPELYKKSFSSLDKPTLLRSCEEQFMPQLVSLFSDPEVLKVEVKRAYCGKRFDEKNLRPSSKLSKLSRAIKNRKVSNRDFFYKDEHHGGAYKGTGKNTKGGVYNVFESKFAYLLGERGKLTTYSTDDLKNQGLFLSRGEEWMSNVLIIDERIQELVYQNSYTIKGETYPYAQLWDDCNVYIPSASTKEAYDLTYLAKTDDGKERRIIHDCKIALNLNATEFSDKYSEDLVRIIKHRFDTDWSVRNETKRNPNEEQVKGLDYLVIHLGVVEKMMSKMRGLDKSKIGDIELFLNKLLKDANCENTKVILTSGRGPTVSTLPPNVAFLPYSVISQYLIENRLKYNLVEVLASARAKA